MTAEIHVICVEIVRGLSTKWDEAAGWELWVEHVAPALSEPTSADTLGYRRFKSALARLSREGVIEKATNNRQAARSVWKLTDEGWNWLDQQGRPVAPEIDVSSYVKRRIRSDKPVPPLIYRELMRLHQAGQLDLVFMSRVTITND